jgi:hypothetical protein
MRTFKLPFTYTVNGEIEIEASNLDNAIAKFYVLATHTSTSGTYPVLDRATKLVPDSNSIEVDEDEARDINPPIKYRVTITRTQSVDVEVEAHDEDDAEELAREKVHDGDMEDYFQDEVIEVENVDEIG